MNVSKRKMDEIEVVAIFSAYNNLSDDERKKIDGYAKILSRKFKMRDDEAIYLLAKIGILECLIETPCQVQVQ